MDESQEIMLKLLSALRTWEGQDEDDREADAVAALATLEAADKLKGEGWRIGADGVAHRR